MVSFDLGHGGVEDSDNQGAEAVIRAGLDLRRYKLSKQDVRVKHIMSAALLASAQGKGG